jgi:hypothetical protein
MTTELHDDEDFTFTDFYQLYDYLTAATTFLHDDFHATSSSDFNISVSRANFNFTEFTATGFSAFDVTSFTYLTWYTSAGFLRPISGTSLD